MLEAALFNKKSRSNKPKRKGASKREASPEPEEDGIAGGGPLSPDLTEVCKKLGNTPQCFYNLNPEIIMQKKLKVGRSLDAVLASFVLSQMAPAHSPPSGSSSSAALALALASASLLAFFCTFASNEGISCKWRRPPVSLKPEGNWASCSVT